MSQSDETTIKKYIDENYITPPNVMRFLCANLGESFFLNVFRQDHPDLHILTADDIRSMSRNYYIENGNNLQQTLKFIESKLKEYYKFLFDIWISFKFTIIINIPAEATEEQIVEDTIIEYLPIKLTMLLYSLFNLFYRKIIESSSDMSKSVTIQQEVTNIVSLYSKLYIFLREPDRSLPYFIFDKRSISLILLLNVMVFKFYDSLHHVSLVIFDNYIHFVNLMFQTFISLFGNTPTPENRNKIDVGLGHVAIFLLDVPNRVLHNDEIQPEYVSKQLMREFENIQIFVDRSVGNSSKFSLKEVMEMKASGIDVTRLFPIDMLVFSPLTPVVLPNAIGMVLEVRRRLNEKQGSTLGDGDSGPIIEVLKQKYPRFEETGDYFSFLQILNNLIDKFTLDHSVNIKDKITARADFSECRIKVPEFELRSRSEMRQITDEKKADSIKKQKELEKEELEKQEQQKQQKSAVLLEEARARKARKEEIEMQRKERIAAAAAEKERIAAAEERERIAASAGLTDKEKEQLTIQRNGNFKNNVKDIFQQFSKDITEGSYQSAADRLNAKLPPKLRLHVPWTEANMKKFQPKVKQEYEKLLASALASSAASQVAVADPSAAEAVDPSSSSAAEAVDPSSSSSSEAVDPSSSAAEAVDPSSSAAEAVDPSSSAAEAIDPSSSSAQAVEASSPKVALSPSSSAIAVVSDARKNAKLIQFEQDIGSLCGGNGVACFTFMFRCTLKQFFRISNFVRKTSDQEIIKMLSTLTPAPGAPPLTEYMKLDSGQTSRSLLGLALLNGLCRHEHVRIVFIGRTFLQLLACHSRLPRDKCIELYIPQETSDIDVDVIFNNDIDPMQYRSFVIHIFNLLWDIPETNIHIQWEKKQKPVISEEVLKQVSEHRSEMETKQFLNASATRAFADAAPPRSQHDMHDNYAWNLFTSSKQGQRIYESISRGSPDTVKFFFNNEGAIGEVSDISFKTSGKFVETFKFPGPPDASIDMLRLLELKYKPRSPLFHEPEFHDVYLEFEFPDAQSGLEECLTIIINTLYSFVTNSFDFAGRKDYYFIHISNLLKFIIRAIQYQGIHLFNQKGSKYNIRELYDEIMSGLLRVLQSRQDIDDKIKEKIENTALNIIGGTFFTPDGFINTRGFEDTNTYRNTEKNARGAATRVGMDLHRHILSILEGNGFDSRFLSKTKLFGGKKYSRRRNRDNKNKYGHTNKQYTRRRHHTKKNKKQQNRKTKRRNKNKKIIKLKFTSSKKMNPTLKINKK